MLGRVMNRARRRLEGQGGYSGRSHAQCPTTKEVVNDTGSCIWQVRIKVEVGML